jgi:DNA-binding NtrC family response regulator
MADDDSEDREMVQEALSEVSTTTKFSEVENGVKLMQWLSQSKDDLPDLLFLDLNMPFKNGYECLEEIKDYHELRSMHIVIYSTSINHDKVDILYKNGAHYYIKKPANFTHIVHVIERMLSLTKEKKRLQPPMQDFIIKY